MFNYIAMNEQRVREGVQKFEPAVGARKYIDQEYQHALESFNTRIYEINYTIITLLIIVQNKNLNAPEYVLQANVFVVISLVLFFKIYLLRSFTFQILTTITQTVTRQKIQYWL
ncbi:unnamed protein product [Paramecium sonneborni]|uniref:Uncharacterized protein n=1 Tax=Paramecium sonneborni TaxID=65129 RepID=A0A8S1K8R8_9CILI|nr:unnamed protein product [Paramecium sonneborni]